MTHPIRQYTITTFEADNTAPNNYKYAAMIFKEDGKHFSSPVFHADTREGARDNAQTYIDEAIEKYEGAIIARQEAAKKRKEQSQ